MSIVLLTYSHALNQLVDDLATDLEITGWYIEQTDEGLNFAVYFGEWFGLSIPFKTAMDYLDTPHVALFSWHSRLRFEAQRRRVMSLTLSRASWGLLAFMLEFGGRLINFRESDPALDELETARLVYRTSYSKPGPTEYQLTELGLIASQYA